MTRIAVVLLLLAGCSGSKVTENDVDWSKYSPQVKQRIARLAQDHRCKLLQDEFDFADAGSRFERAKTGEGNADLMAYIDQKMQDSDC